MNFESPLPKVKLIMSRQNIKVSLLKEKENPYITNRQFEQHEHDKKKSIFIIGAPKGLVEPAPHVTPN